jgi:predicted phage replisome organizer
MSEITKKYFWLKLKNTFFSDPLIRKLRQINDSCAVIYLKMMLYSIENNGIIELRGLEPTPEEEVAFLLNEDITHVRLTIGFLRQAQMIKDNNGAVFMVVVPTLIGAEGASAERMRKLRSKKLIPSQCDTDVRKCDTEIELELERDLELEKDSL